ncbi:MAG: hypothetical protein HYY34_02945 [Chloroflexi bacterium]|nr:hypothetical protein [Chloroflexota bacterium]
MTPEDIRAIVVRDYLVMAYLGTLGAIQIATAISGLSGLWFIPNRTATRLLGACMVGAGIAFFFLAPLWTAGPWGSVPGGRIVIGAEGEPVPWGKASYRDLPQARNINDVNGGLSGTSQALWFASAAGAAIATTYALGSIINFRRNAPVGVPGEGIESLKGAAVHRVLGRSIRYWRDSWRTEARSLKSGARPERVHPAKDKSANHGDADREDGGARS